LDFSLGLLKLDRLADRNRIWNSHLVSPLGPVFTLADGQVFVIKLSFALWHSYSNVNIFVSSAFKRFSAFDKFVEHVFDSSLRWTVGERKKCLGITLKWRIGKCGEINRTTSRGFGQQSDFYLKPVVPLCPSILTAGGEEKPFLIYPQHQCNPGIFPTHLPYDIVSLMQTWNWNRVRAG
jgi:hypothetical protein